MPCIAAANEADGDMTGEDEAAVDMFGDDFESTGLEWMDAPVIGTGGGCMEPLSTLFDVAAGVVDDGE